MQVRLLGPVDVVVGGVARPVAGRRRQAVLAVLGLAAGDVVSADRLIEVVWADAAPPTAGNTLQHHVSYLRGVFGDRAAIATRGSGYALNVDGGAATDVRVAERLIRDARQSTQPARSASYLRAALALWRGRPLADLADLRWLDEQADRLADLRVQAEQGLIEARLALGEHAQVVPELERLTVQHPFHEDLHGQLMLGLYRAGRQADALAVYQRLRQVLREELGVDPGPRLRELEAAILRQDSALDGRPAGLAVAPERQPDPAAVPAQLPATVDGFAGRQAQLDVLDSLLAAARGGGAPTLIIGAIGGAAGVGKTALAVYWSHRVRHHFPDGQLQVDLRGYATGPPMPPGQALARFLRALGVPPEHVPLDVAEAAAMYRTLLADRRMLIVLDNAANPGQVRPLLPGSPHCLVLVTSRDRLGGLIVSDGARLLPLDVLDDGEAQALLRGILGGARADAEPHALAELAKVCGFLPLALRIAAANLVMRPHTGIGDYVADLRDSDRLAALQVDGDDRSAVRAAFDPSYAALTPAEQRLFRLLGVVPGADIDVPAAAALAGSDPDEVRHLLRGLVDGHLVIEPTRGRYALHDLLKLYARTLAEAADGPDATAAATARLAAFYLGATDAAADLLYAWMTRLPAAPDEPRGHRPPLPFAGHQQALDWLDAERANLVAFIHESAEHGPRPAAWRLSDNLRGYLYLRRDAGDWLAVATDALRAAEGHPGPQAAAQLSLGIAHTTKGHYDAAIAAHTAALGLAERAGWLEGTAAALNNLGTVHSQTGRHREAAVRFTQMVAVNDRAGCPVGQAIGLDNLGIVRRELGELETAAALHRRAIALYHELGSRHDHATALDNLAAACHDRGRLDEALRFYTEALALHRQTGDRDREATCLYGVASVHCSAGRPESAREPARAAFALAREIGDHRSEANAALVLATVDHHLGRHRSALDRSRHAERLAARTDSRYVRARALVATARAELGLHRADAAHATVREALTLIVEHGYRAVQVDALTVLAGVHHARGRSADAASTARTARALRQEIGYHGGGGAEPDR
jgi:DNA-binding SARP family transcriptional activator